MGIFACNCGYFDCNCIFLPAIASNFICQSRAILHEFRMQNYPLYSGKFVCGCKQFTCILREVFAAYKLVNWPLFTGKFRVTHVVWGWGLFTCGSHSKVPALADIFARVSFTMYSGYTSFWLPTDHILDIYGPDYGPSESINGSYYGCPDPTIKKQTGFVESIKPFLFSSWCIWGFASWNASQDWIRQLQLCLFVPLRNFFTSIHAFFRVFFWGKRILQGMLHIFFCHFVWFFVIVRTG